MNYENDFEAADMDKNSVSSLLSHGPWPPSNGEHLAIFQTGPRIQIGEFICCINKASEKEELEVKIYKQYLLDTPSNLHLWQHCDDNKYIVKRSCISPV